MSERKSKKVKMDALKAEPKIVGKPFDYDHAINLMKLQQKNGHRNWTINPEENLKFENGDFISTKATKNS